MTQYYLRSPILGKCNLIDISEERYLLIKNAHKALNAFVNITENYYCVLNAFNAMEVTQFKIIQRDITTKSSPYFESLYNRAKLISSIQCYLSNAKYYLDTTGRILSKILPDECYHKYKNKIHEIYDSTPSYKFVEELRNYSQHRSRPFDFVTSHAGMDDTHNPDKSGIAFSLTLSISKDRLKLDTKFKKSALDEKPDKIDVCHTIRGHMSCIWQAYNYVYTEHVDIATNARRQFAEAIQEVKTNFSDKVIALEAVATEDNHINDSVPILLDWDDARLTLHKSVNPLFRLDKCYATLKMQ